MRRYDHYWMSNDEWYYIDKDGNIIIKDNAPEDAKKTMSITLNRRSNEKRWRKICFYGICLKNESV